MPSPNPIRLTEEDFPVEMAEEGEFHETQDEREIPIAVDDFSSAWIEPPLPLQSDYPWCPVPWRQPVGFGWWVIRTVFSLISLLLILAIVAAVPILNFIALGYLLEVESRVARTGRLLAAFPLLNQAARIGVVAAGLWIYLLPLRLLSGYAADAQLIDPGSPTANGLRVGVALLWGLTTLHLLMALARGGTIGSFINPPGNALWLARRLWEGNYLETAGANVRDFLKLLQLRGLFLQGLRGFGVAFLWLFVPTLLFAAVRRPEGVPVLIMLFGGFLLVMALMWAPFLQARAAAAGRFRPGLHLGEIRQLWQYAPLAWTFAIILLYVLALPLYLFKAVLLPQDAMWVMTLVFIATIYPTRIMTGWAYGRSVRRRQLGLRAHWLLRALCGWVLWPLLGIYVFLLFFTQFVGAEGKLVLFAHHALLLPAPFFLTLD